MMMVVIIKTLTMYGFRRNRQLNALRFFMCWRSWILFVCCVACCLGEGEYEFKMCVCVCVCARARVRLSIYVSAIL